MAAWNEVNVVGISHQELKIWEEVHKTVVESAYEVIGLKGYTSRAMRCHVADLIESTLKNLSGIHRVLVTTKGVFGVEKEVFLSLPS